MNEILAIQIHDYSDSNSILNDKTIWLLKHFCPADALLMQN